MDKHWTKINSSLQNHFSNYIHLGNPNLIKRYQLAKLICYEKDVSIEMAINQVASFYQIPYRDRTDSRFHQHFSIIPYPWLVEQFLLNFKTIQQNETLIQRAVADVKFYFQQLEQTPPPELAHESILLQSAFHALKKCWSSESSLGLFDFLKSWKRQSFLNYGEKYEWYFEILFEEIEKTKLEDVTLTEIKKKTISLTQTEIDWLRSIKLELENKIHFSTFPLSTGPKKAVLIEIERITRTLNRLGSVEPEIEFKLTGHLKLKINQLLMINEIGVA
jgi:hypothetical protein